MDWEVRPETEKPDPELAEAVSEAARVAAAVDAATSHVPLGVRIVALIALLGIGGARAGAPVELIVDLVQDFYAQERERIASRGH